MDLENPLYSLRSGRLARPARWSCTFETARRREQVGERLATALGGLIAD